MTSTATPAPGAAVAPGLPSVSTAYARAWRAFLDDQGLAGAGRDAPALAPFGALPADAPAPPAHRVDGTAFGQALVQGRRLLGDPMLGVRFGLRVGGGGFGLLGIAAATAATLGQSILQLQRFESLTSTLGRVRAERDGDRVTLSWSPHQPVAPAVVEGILAGWVSFGRHLLDTHVRVHALGFTHARAASLSAYEAALDCPVRFGEARTHVTIDADLLDARPRLADARLNAHLLAWLDRCTFAIDAPPAATATGRVMQALARAPTLDRVDIGQAARTLGLGPRTLQRRLADEGSNFRALLDAARGQHALTSLLRERESLSQLGADIGFDEQSSLCRAFRRWTGYAPLALKSRLPGFTDDLRAPA